MSNHLQLFFDCGHPDVTVAAEALASALDMETNRLVDSTAVYTTRFSDEFPIEFGGEVESNVYSFSERIEDEAVFDGIPTLWTLRTRPRMKPETERALVDEVTTRLTARKPGWRLVLTDEFELLEATFDSDRGWRTYPRGTYSRGGLSSPWR